MTQLRDAHNRQIDYLRMSVTDRCDFRCVYCMAEDMTFLPRQQVLGLEELERIARIFVGLGVKKIRLTGGEPLVRQGIVGLCERIAALPGLRELVMTTNGSQLVRLAAPLARAGVKRLNISLDSLDAEKFHAITRTGQLQQVLDDLIVPNGLAFSPDGRTMYLSDSHPGVQKIWAFDYDTDSGTPSRRRLFVDMLEYPGRPDGAAVDAEGCYWICGNDAGLIHRFTPDGRLDRSLAVPVKKPTMCAFGGPRLDTLYVTSIRPGGDLADQPLAGGLFALNPGVTGIEEPAFTRN